MKPVQFSGRSLRLIRAFPDSARREAGHQLDRLQRGLDPSDWKPMPSIGRGVREIRIRAEGRFRVIYTAIFHGRIAVLHALQKKTRKTRTRDIERAKHALTELRSSIGNE